MNEPTAVPCDAAGCGRNGHTIRATSLALTAGAAELADFAGICGPNGRSLAASSAGVEGELAAAGVAAYLASLDEELPRSDGVLPVLLTATSALHAGAPLEALAVSSEGLDRWPSHAGLMFVRHIAQIQAGELIDTDLAPRTLNALGPAVPLALLLALAHAYLSVPVHPRTAAQLRSLAAAIGAPCCVSPSARKTAWCAYLLAVSARLDGRHAAARVHLSAAFAALRAAASDPDPGLLGEARRERQLLGHAEWLTRLSVGELAHALSEGPPASWLPGTDVPGVNNPAPPAWSAPAGPLHVSILSRGHLVSAGAAAATTAAGVAVAVVARWPGHPDDAIALTCAAAATAALAVHLPSSVRRSWSGCAGFAGIIGVLTGLVGLSVAGPDHPFVLFPAATAAGALVTFVALQLRSSDPLDGPTAP